MGLAPPYFERLNCQEVLYPRSATTEKSHLTNNKNISKYIGRIYRANQILVEQGRRNQSIIIKRSFLWSIAFQDPEHRKNVMSASDHVESFCYNYRRSVFLCCIMPHFLQNKKLATSMIKSFLNCQ